MGAEKSEKQKYESVRDILVEFMRHTTGHGFARLVAATSIARRMFWIVAVLGATGMFVFQVSDLFRHYLSRPVQTSVTVTFEKQLKFPAVTICNLNVIRKSKMTMLPMHLIDKFFTVNITKNRTPFDIFTDNLFGDLNGTLGSGFNTSDYFDGAVNNVTEETDDGINSTSEPARRKNPPSDNEEDGGSGGDNRTPEDRDSSDEDELGLEEIFPDVFKDFLGVENSSPDMILKMNVESYIGGEDPDRLISYGHQQENLIKSCTWKGVDCAKGNLSKLWTSSWNYKYGNCYTFNNGVDYEDSPIEVLQSSKPGPSQGLVLQLDIEENEYIGELSNEAGVRVVLHEQGVMHFPYEEGFSVAPGMATSVGITKTMMKRLDRFDNGSCFDKSVQLAKDNLYRGKQNITRYSMQACLNSCLGVSQLAMCKCADVSYPTGKPCDLFNPRERNCLLKVKYLFSKDQLSCIKKCKRPCREDVYEKTISISQWPSTAHMTFLEKSGSPMANRSSVLQLNVFYSQLNYHVIEESYSYGTTNLLADIGGQLGLWIGISALTCGEVLELIFQILTFFYMKFKKRRETRVIKIGGYPE